MASIDIYTHTASVNTIGRTFSDYVHSVFARYENWKTARATRAELYNLTPRELADIGIFYCDIKNIR